MEKPPSLYDREAEWDDLVKFVTGRGPRLRLGILYGRRRFGKTFLLRRLVESLGGVYHLALQEGRRPGLDRFAQTLGRYLAGSPPIRFDDWHSAVSHAVSMLGERGAGPAVMVLDEYPYLRAGSPEMDSVIQAVIDEAAIGDFGSGWSSPVTVIVCGSAMSVMTGIVSGSSPMRGRAMLDLPLAAFDYRQARNYWGITDPTAAFSVDSVLGGAAGYKDLTASVPVPTGADEFVKWLSSTVLNPSHALFREDEYLLREDPRITAEAPYYSLLGAIAAGRTSQGRIAATVGRAPGDIVHHLKVMTTAGFLVRDHDLLTSRRPSYRIADPIVRFSHLVTRRHLALLEDRRAGDAWSRAAPTYRSNVVGPHFEWICRRWVDRYASAKTLGGPTGPARRLRINHRDRRRAFELDMAVPSDQPWMGTSASRVPIQAIGEAKAARMGAGDLQRLDRIAALLAENQRVSAAPGIKLLLFSQQGFSTSLAGAARHRPDVELVDFERLYDGS